jgi:ABC-type protease/lipase transport system fused ATPase/permease subunit
MSFSEYFGYLRNHAKITPSDGILNSIFPGKYLSPICAAIPEWHRLGNL